jgi:glycosyltransferase involved in cell wall biosynthesis
MHPGDTRTGKAGGSLDSTLPHPAHGLIFVVRETGPGPVPISVIMPAFNAEAHIAAALASIRAQTAAPAEVIVVDDASTDRTCEIARAWGARVIEQASNGGPAAARNAGAAAASSPWIAFLDADDAWHPNKLAAQWSALGHWPDAGLCFTGYHVQFSDGASAPGDLTHPVYTRIARTGTIGAAVRFDPDSLLRGFVQLMFVLQSSVLVRRSAFERCGGYDETYRLGEDYDLILRLMSDVPVIAVERPLVVYRRHAASLSADRVAEITAIDRLWNAILARPERYEPRVVELVRSQRAATLARGVTVALRQGCFSDARSFAGAALARRPSPQTLALFGLSLACSSPLGRGLHYLARTAWRARTRPWTTRTLRRSA